MSLLAEDTVGDHNHGSFDLMQNRIESLSNKMDKLINIQEKVLNRLDGMSHADGIERDVETAKDDKEEIQVPPRVVSQSQVMGQDMRQMCKEMSSIMSAVNQRSEQQAQKLEGMEKLVLSMQQVISFIAETVKSSPVMGLMFKTPAAQKSATEDKGKQAVKSKSSSDILSTKVDQKTTSNKATKGSQAVTPACDPSTAAPSYKIKLHGPKHFLAARKCGRFLKDRGGKDGTEKPSLSFTSPKTEKKMMPPDTADSASLKKQVLILEEVHKLNKENAEKSSQHLEHHSAEVTPKDPRFLSSVCNLVEQPRKDIQAVEPKVAEDKKREPEANTKDSVSLLPEKQELLKDKEEVQEIPEAVKEEEAAAPAADAKEDAVAMSSSKDHKGTPVPPMAEMDTVAGVSSTAVTEEGPTEESTKSHPDEEAKKNTEDEETEEDGPNSEGLAIFKAAGVEFQLDLKERVEKARQAREAEADGKQEEEEEDDDEVERYYIDKSPPPAAPFTHRIVSAKPNQIVNFYTISWQEVLGGGRFGQVHKCVENSSGLTLAAKVIKARTQKEKDVVKNEIQVMNHLDHSSLIQLYAAYESRNDIILVLEHVGGGELFDRIIDENYKLMELDAVLLIRQICEGLQHMHRMYILHLDLKPENILCVNRVTNKVKIIDFGLARIYKPREKLKVNFGTPEFLAPEIVNYDFVSFNTDMWSLGVITYMLLSSLCPFLGDTDGETLNNILACRWSFEEQEFEDTSPEAKDFISKLLIMNKMWRMGAAEALRHPWLSDPVLHHRLYTKKNMCRSRRSSCVPVTD